MVEADNIPLPQGKKIVDPGKKFRSGFLDKIPAPIKALFVKFWFYGAVCFFIYWGLGIFIPSMENMILVLSIVLGMITDLMVNNIYRFFSVVPGDNDKWMMFPKKKYVNFFLNIIYAFIIVLTVVWIYNVINGICNSVMGTTDRIYLGVEPLMFGLFAMGVDMFFITIKKLFVSIIRDAKK